MGQTGPVLQTLFYWYLVWGPRSPVGVQIHCVFLTEMRFNCWLAREKNEGLRTRGNATIDEVVGSRQPLLQHTLSRGPGVPGCCGSASTSVPALA